MHRLCDHLRCLIAAMLLATVWPGLLMAQQVGEALPAALAADQGLLQQAIDQARELRRRLGELRAVVDREPAGARTRFITLLADADQQFGNLRLSAGASVGNHYQTGFFRSLRAQADDTHDAQRLAELMQRADIGLAMLIGRLHELHEPVEVEQDRPQRLAEAKESLDKIHELLMGSPDDDEPDEVMSRNTGWLTPAASYSRVVLWVFLVATAVMCVYLAVRWWLRRQQAGVAEVSSLATLAETLPLESPEDHRRQALAALERLDLRLAMHHFQLMALSALDRAGLIALDRARTNWELYDQLVRRNRHHLAAVLADMNRTYDRKWYGGEGLGGDEVADFGRLAEGLRREVGDETP